MLREDKIIVAGVLFLYERFKDFHVTTAATGLGLPRLNHGVRRTRNNTSITLRMYTCALCYPLRSHAQSTIHGVPALHSRCGSPKRMIKQSKGEHAPTYDAAMHMVCADDDLRSLVANQCNT